MAEFFHFSLKMISWEDCILGVKVFKNELKFEVRTNLDDKLLNNNSSIEVRTSNMLRTP